MNDRALDAAVGVEQRSQRRRRRSGLQWRKLIDEQAEGEATVEAFCQERGLTLSSFHAWRRRLKRAAQSEASGFVELRAQADESVHASQDSSDRLEIRLGSATVLAPLSSLAEVIAALSSQAQRRC